MQDDFDMDEFGAFPVVASLAKQVEDRIRSAITSGKMNPNVLYTEPNLAKQMGVSRTPVREAVLELASRGLVTVLPRRGFQVRNFTPGCVREVYDLRIALELHAVEVLARNPEKYDFDLALETVASQEKGATKSEIENVVQFGRDFHLELLKLAGNSMAIKVFDDIRDILNVTWTQAFSRSISAQVVVDDHKKLIEMIKHGEGAKAREFLRKHLLRSEQAVLEALQQAE